MAKSRKRVPVIKDNANTGEYWRPIRREWKQRLKKNWDDPDLHLRNRREIHNDWSFWDWKWYMQVDDEHFQYPDRKSEDFWGITYEDVEKAFRK